MWTNIIMKRRLATFILWFIFSAEADDTWDFLAGFELGSRRFVSTVGGKSFGDPLRRDDLLERFLEEGM
jgi:hypothetical protein